MEVSSFYSWAILKTGHPSVIFIEAQPIEISTPIRFISCESTPFPRREDKTLIIVLNSLIICDRYQDEKEEQTKVILSSWKYRIVIFERKSTWLFLLSSLYSLAVKWTEPDDVGHPRHNLKAFPALIHRNKWKKPNWFVVPLLTFTSFFGAHLPFDIDHNSKSPFSPMSSWSWTCLCHLILLDN